MRRPVVAVLVCTCVALMAVTLWAPMHRIHRTAQLVGRGATTESNQTITQTDLVWGWIGRAIEGERERRNELGELLTIIHRDEWTIHWPALVIVQTALLALGGLLAVLVHTRAARKRAA